MTKHVFAFDELCNGCQSCVYWCAFACNQTLNRTDSKIKIAKNLEGKFDMPLVDCHSYKQVNETDVPLCVEMCPTATTSHQVSPEEFPRISERWINLERAYIAREGFRWQEDRPPHPWAGKHGQIAGRL